MVIYVHQQKQRNHLGLTPATGALILHLRLEKFMNSLADSNKTNTPSPPLRPLVSSSLRLPKAPLCAERLRRKKALPFREGLG